MTRQQIEEKIQKFSEEANNAAQAHQRCIGAIMAMQQMLAELDAEVSPEVKSEE